MSRSLKVLTATTAFAAAAAGANAAVITTNGGPIQTSETVGITYISDSAIISSSVGSAIEISSTDAVSNSINVGYNAVVSASHATSATIEALATGAGTDGAVTLDISGSVIQNGDSGKAIDLSQLAGVGSTIGISGTISGSITGSGGADAITIRGGTISGAIAGGGGGGTDTVTFAAPNFTLTGGVGGVENLAFSSGVTQIDSTIADAPAVTVAAGATAGISQTNTISTLGLTGTLGIAGDTTLTASGAVTINAGSHIMIGIDSSSSAGNFNATGDALNDINNASMSIVMGSNAGFIASGTTYQVAVGNAGQTVTPTLLTTQNGLYSFDLTTSGDGVSLTVLRASTASLVNSDAGSSIANTLDNLANNATGDLATIQNLITSADSAARVNQIVESLTPAVDTGAAITSVGVNVQAGNNVSNRLASLRGSGLATGDYGKMNHMWVQGFGAVGEQDDKNGNAGYDSNTAGASFGVDTDTLVPGATVGAAFSYAHSNVDSNAANNAETSIDSYIATVYGSRVLDQGYFVNGQASIGFNKNETERQVVGFNTKTKGDYDSMQYGLKGEVGRDIVNGNMIITPLASLQYTYLDSDKYTETGPAALTVDGEGFSALDAGVGAAVAWEMPMNRGGVLRPELRANYTYRMGDNKAETTSNFVAGGASFSTQGVEADRSAVNLGAGLMLTSAGGMDVSVDYDADIRSSYTGHTGQVKLRWAF